MSLFQNQIHSAEDAVAFFHSLQVFGIKPGLERISSLCHLLGDVQENLSFVHVAGTNGKGSTCTEIASVLSQAGFRVGLYTSPYVIDFRERMQINGEMIPDDDLIRVTVKTQEAVLRLQEDSIVITEFEALTAAAFLWFSECRCDVVVLETGLGGRFDATNVISSPLVSVITSISMDHMAILGDSISKIAYEKCGIIKPCRPVVTTASQPKEALDVIRRVAYEKSAPLLIADESVMFTGRTVKGYRQTADYNGLVLSIPFPGIHQLQNAALAVVALQSLREQGWKIPDEAIFRGIAEARIPARTEILYRDPVVLLDGSHNDGSTKALAEVLPSIVGSRRTVAVMGMMADKEISAALDHLLGLFDSVIAVTPSNPRALPASEFAKLVRARGVSCTVIESPVRAVDYALHSIEPETQALVICGSLYLAADVRAYLLHKLKEFDQGGKTNVDVC